MSVQRTYADLEIHIGKLEERGYPVEMTVNNALEFRRGYLDRDVLDWSMETGASWEERGQRLFERLLSDERVKAAWSEVRGKYPLRRIRLNLDVDAPELHTIPWELLREEIEGDLAINLAAADATPFSRYLTSPHEHGVPIDERPLKILVAIANPANLGQYDLQEIDVKGEWDSLQRSIGDLNVHLIPGPQPCTLEALEAMVREGAHVLHFIGHGAYSQSDGRAVILMANRNNQIRFVVDDEHAGMLARQDASTNGRDGANLRLVFLASCETATRSPKDAYRGFGPKLIDAGVPAVLAMQDQVSVETARAFTRTFYQQLLHHGWVDLAANQARSALLTEDLPGAHVPVLFMRLKDGQLLAPDPVRAALEAICQDKKYSFYSEDRGEYLPLPIEVIHLSGRQDFRGGEQAAAGATAAMEVLRAARDVLVQPLEESGDKVIPRFVVLMGGYGSNKSTQLERMVWQTAQDSLASSGKSLILPVYVALEEFPRVRRTQESQEKPIEALMLDSLRAYWDDLTPSELDDLLKRDDTKLRIMFDGSENLTERQRQEACRQICTFITNYPRHQYVLSADPLSFDQSLLSEDENQPDDLSFHGPELTEAKRCFQGLDRHILVIQPLERQKIRHFLQTLPDRDTTGKDLLKRLDETGLFDLAAVPWFMLKMMLRARMGQYPESRTQVVQQMIEDAIATIPPEQGMQAHAERVLRALARQMQFRLTTTLPLADAFAIMSRIRGNREYHLETFFDAMVNSNTRLLARAGTDHLRFAYSRYQAYFCAQAIVQDPERNKVLDDVTASLGRLTRLRWWEETILFVCGLLAHDIEELERFLNVMVYGVDLLECEQAFLAARCLMESKQRVQSATDRMQGLAEQVVAALAWRLDNRNEPRSTQRSRAAHLLGQLADASAIEHLAHTAYEKARWDRHGERDFDYSNVRMAAIIGILRMSESVGRRILERIDQCLWDLLQNWRNWKVEGLTQELKAPKNPSTQGLAALALGDLYPQLVLDPERQEQAKDVLWELKRVFLDDETDPATLWAVTYALAKLDLPTVNPAKLLRMLLRLEQQGGLSPDDEWCTQHHKCMAYLVGLLRWQDHQAHTYLVERCLKGTGDPRLAATAVEALGRLAFRKDKHLLEELALGPVEQVLPSLASAEPKDLAYVQRKAVDALAVVGDLKTVDKLRASRRIEEMDRANWDPDVERALYRTSEEIYWRLYWNIEGEPADPGGQ
jgi:hypothetical protein